MDNSVFNNLWQHNSAQYNSFTRTSVNMCEHARKFLFFFSSKGQDYTKFSSKLLY